MADPPDQVMRRYCVAWQQGDFATVVATWADDIVAHVPGRSWFSGTYTGKPAVIDASLRIQKHAPRYPVGIHDYLVSGEHGVVLARERAVRNEEVLEVNRIYVFHMAVGKIAELWVYEYDQDAVDRFYS
ncbi:MAG: nuclear transport factor 2 family protein [Actinomycetota bacterium]|nr:nuclear transport factor 2 family protein [Actinomycetota bacterium]